MDKDLAFNALFSRYQESKLAHFYTLHTSSDAQVEEKEELLNKWCENLLINILAHENNWTIEHAKDSLALGHEDILIINTDEKSYKVSDKCIEELFNFIRFKPSKLKYSFTIFKQSQKISPILANKLLKTLEEPPEGHLFLFLKSSDEKTLETIDSRTIKINITSTSATRQAKSYENFKDYIKNKCQDDELSQTLASISQTNLCLDKLKDLIKEAPETEAKICHLISEYLANDATSDIHKVQLCLDAIEQTTREIPFNGASKSRLARILQLVV